MRTGLTRLNLGCASQIVDGWINVDYALGARLAKMPFFRALNRKMGLFGTDWNPRILIHNLTKRFPWSDASVDVVYSSHTLEHFPKADGLRFLTECHRVLRKNGIIRIVVPDLRPIIDGYVLGRIPADGFLGRLGVVSADPGNTFKRRLSALFSVSPHMCMYDSPRLVQILDEIGFEASTRSPFDSDIEDIRTIEQESRTENAAIVEGRKT